MTAFSRTKNQRGAYRARQVNSADTPPELSRESSELGTITPSYPNRFARYLFRAMAVEMGEHGLNAVLCLALGDMPVYQAYIDQMPANNLDKAFAFSAVAALNQALETYYDSDGSTGEGANREGVPRQRIGRGMALRIGRAWFYQGMKGFGALGGIETPAVARLDPTTRCRLALNALAHIFTHFSDQNSWLDESERVFRFMVDPCATSWGLHAERPMCQMMVGLLQECVRWASGGLDYAVRETNCRAVEGGACIFVINKQPTNSAPSLGDSAHG